MTNPGFSTKLITWYHQNKRDLPWRNIKDPYKIWLSEIILQQTRVAQGLPYYEKFIENYPTVNDLANADEKEVLRLWQGLGYYSRARSLHTTARIIAKDFEGVFPNTYHELLKLKGIGPYTAAAIASFAFDENVAVVDGNVFRILARIFGIETDISSHQAKKVFGELANRLISEKDPSTHNQAMMEFGATYCTPHNPECMFCTFHFDCEANASGRQAILPIKSKKIKVKQRFFYYFLIEQNEKFLLHQRKKSDIWAGLFDFYLEERSTDLQSVSSQVGSNIETILEETKDNFLKETIKKSTIKSISENHKHILTHQRIEAKFIHLKLNENIDLPDSFEFYSRTEIEDLPKPILIEKYLKKTLK